MTPLSTCGARTRLVIKPPDRINSSQAISVHESRSVRLMAVFIGIATAGAVERSDS